MALNLCSPVLATRVLHNLHVSPGSDIRWLTVSRAYTASFAGCCLSPSKASGPPVPMTGVTNRPPVGSRVLPLSRRSDFKSVAPLHSWDAGGHSLSKIRAVQLLCMPIRLLSE